MMLSSGAALSSRGSVFETAAGSVTGRDHRRAHRDGQDGFARVATPSLTAAIVTDGCSSGRMSEVGARLGAVWLAELVRRFFPARDPERAARDVTAALVERLAVTARSLSGGDAIVPSLVGELLLFGFLAAVVTRETAIVFGVGDGIVWVGRGGAPGQVTVIDPGPENAPSYAAYALLGMPIEPRVLYLGETQAIDALVVATDGVEELLDATSRVDLPSPPSLDELARDDRIFTNASLLRKRLVVLSDRGFFQDDATIGIVRRRR